MKQRPKVSRTFLGLAITGIVLAAVVVLMLPKPQEVDLGDVERGDLSVVIVEEARTSVRETYIVSTPVAGQLMRVQLHPGDAVLKNKTVVARMVPTLPSVLDSRTREQAMAAVEAASAAVRLAQANLNAALAVEDLSRSELERTLALFDREIVSKAALDRAQSAHRADLASRETAEAAIAMREAELANAQASLVGRDDTSLANAIADQVSLEIPLYSPIDGRILQVLQESKTVLPAGAPVMEIGDVASDLEVVVELISSDAVQVSVGDPVILTDWGKDNALAGHVARVDPFGITKVSALGIEEQRVRVEIELDSPFAEREGLGHGYRLEARIIVWQAKDILLVPTSALFRDNGTWYVFRAADGYAAQTQVQIGKSDGVRTQLLSGLGEADRVIVYPSAAIADGKGITDRGE